MTIDQFEDLDELERRLRMKLESVVADLLIVLGTDLATFVARETRNRFVSSEEFSESLDDETVLRLKRRAAEVGEVVAEELTVELADDMDFWFGPEVPIGEGKTFNAHTHLMERLQRVAHETEAMLREFGFPEDTGSGYGLSYAPPAYFVNGKYAPGLAENFWKYLAQLNEVRESRRQQDAGRRRAVQRHRWDTIERKDKDKKSS